MATQCAILGVPESFSLEAAVCSYGFFMTAPNQWEPATSFHSFRHWAPGPGGCGTPLVGPGQAAGRATSLDLTQNGSTSSNSDGMAADGMGRALELAVNNLDSAEGHGREALYMLDTCLAVIGRRGALCLWTERRTGAFRRPLRLACGSVARVKLTEIERQAVPVLRDEDSEALGPAPIPAKSLLPGACEHCTSQSQASALAPAVPHGGHSHASMAGLPCCDVHNSSPFPPTFHGLVPNGNEDAVAKVSQPQAGLPSSSQDCGVPQAASLGLVQRGNSRAAGGRGLLVQVEHDSPLGAEDWARIQAQVVRMLRLRTEDEAQVQAFQALHPDARLTNFGRLIRSPTLFEDMVKSVLLCNCGWGRTLSMNQALCELQAELALAKKIPAKTAGAANETLSKLAQAKESSANTAAGAAATTLSNGKMQGSRGKTARASGQEEGSGSDDAGKAGDAGPGLVLGDFPEASELAGLDAAFLAKRCGLGYRAQRILTFAQKVASKEIDLEALEAHPAISGDDIRDDVRDDVSRPESQAAVMQTEAHGHVPQTKRRSRKVSKSDEGRSAQGDVASEAVVNGTGLPTEPQGAIHPIIEDLKQTIVAFPGFGPYSGANVMQCLGVFALVPADSETIRHLRQVKGIKDCHVANVQAVSQKVYGVFAPYQFLAYWWEIWQDYSRVFGPIHQVSRADYAKFTGPNMTRARLSVAIGVIEQDDGQKKAKRKKKEKEQQEEGCSNGAAPEGGTIDINSDAAVDSVASSKRVRIRRKLLLHSS